MDGYEWDWLGRLARVGGTTVAVDALGDLAEADGMALLWDRTQAVPQLRWIDGASIVGDDRPWATVGRDGDVEWLDHDWQGSVGGGPRDPWGAGAPTGELGLGYRGELELDGLVWLRNRAYDPGTRAFLSTDPLPGVPGRPVTADPYHYGGNDPVNAFDPFGLRPMTEADLAAYREAAASSGLFDPVTGWVADNWEYLAAGAMIIAGGALLFTGAGIVLGGALLAGGLSVGSQRLLNGQVNWTQVGVDMAIGGLSAGAGSWASGLTSTSAAAWSTTSRVALQVGVSTTVDVGGGMAGRQLTGQDPFDPQAMAIDTLTGVAGGGIDALRAPRPGIVPKTWDYGMIDNPTISGFTDGYGQITVRSDVAPEQFWPTLRHEQVHAALSPTEGTMFAGTRAAIGGTLYNKSQLWQYGEEALAEGYATRNLPHALRFPFEANYKLSPQRVLLEAAGVGATGAAGVGAYVGHEVLGD